MEKGRLNGKADSVTPEGPFQGALLHQKRPGRSSSLLEVLAGGVRPAERSSDSLAIRMWAPCPLCGNAEGGGCYLLTLFHLLSSREVVKGLGGFSPKKHVPTELT